MIIMGDAGEHFGTTESACKESIASEFCTNEIQDYEVLAAYSADICCYEQECWFLLRKDDTLYVVEGSHCSCHGYEDQWSPQRVTVGYIQNYNGACTRFQVWGELLKSLDA